MLTETTALEEQLKCVKYRIQILDMIEAKLREIKTLVVQIRDGNITEEKVSCIQAQVNELIKEVIELNKI